MKNLTSALFSILLLFASVPTALGQIPDDINGRLYRLAKVWGLAKYYHPDNCTVDPNNIIVAAIDSVLESTSNQSFNDAMMRMLQTFGDVPTASEPLEIESDINLNASFTWKDDMLFSQDVRDFLNDILVNFRSHPSCLVVNNYGVDPDYVGYLSFQYDNLRAIPDFSYDKESHRLLALFYYWNIINYFNPNNDLMDQDWDTTLYQFIPLIREAKNDTAFHVRFLNLVTYINDSHGFTNSPLTRAYFGTHFPLLGIKPIENKSVVTSVGDTIPEIKVGDIIKKINGIDIDILLDSLRQYVPASNESSLQRDLHELMISGPEASTIDIEFEDASGAIHTISLIRDAPRADYYDWLLTDPKPMFEITDCGYGYINMGKLSSAFTTLAYNNLKSTPAIIFDIRNYPKGTLWYLLPLLLESPKTWALLPEPDLTYPGWYNWYNNRFDAGNFFNPQPYNGKVIILTNAETQSQAEYTVMGLQTHPNAFTIGSQTAGADGNISNIVLPGGLYSYWSSLGVFYPDTTDTQRTGIRIDSVVTPTIEDIRKGKDRVLLAALDCLTETADLRDMSKLSLQPNPVTDVLYVSMYNDQYTEFELQVTNSAGQKVVSQKIHSSSAEHFEINVSDWSQGVYFIQFMTKDKIISMNKFVKQ